MASLSDDTPYPKILATLGGLALTGMAAWLNAEHVAAAEGWASPLTAAGVIVMLCVALTPALIERMTKDGQWAKAVALWAFFGLAVCFSLSTSIGRNAGHRDTQVAGAEQTNARASLAREAYQAAQTVHQAECASGRGAKCRAAETRLDEARMALGDVAPARASDPGAERIAAVMGVNPASVRLYSPMLLPGAMELGAVVFLSVGLAPRRRERKPATARKPRAKATPKRKPGLKLAA